MVREEDGREGREGREQTGITRMRLCGLYAYQDINISSKECIYPALETRWKWTANHDVEQD